MRIWICYIAPGYKKDISYKLQQAGKDCLQQQIFKTFSQSTLKKVLNLVSWLRVMLRFPGDMMGFWPKFLLGTTSELCFTSFGCHCCWGCVEDLKYLLRMYKWLLESGAALHSIPSQCGEYLMLSIEFHGLLGILLQIFNCWANTYTMSCKEWVEWNFISLLYIIE